MHIKFFVVVMTLLACVGCDQASKALAKAYLPRNEIVSLAGDTIRLEYTQNKGVFLSVGFRLSKKTRSILFTFGVGVVVVGILGYLAFVPALPRLTKIALSLIAGSGFAPLEKSKVEK